jgi:probable selenium-dependent hydroxylase accessory protein YqeC
MQRDAAMDNMWTALGLGKGACVAFIGGGGKTTSILALIERATAEGLRVVVTTTTKMWPPSGIPLVLRADGRELVDLVHAQFRNSAVVALGRRLAESGKLLGLEPQGVCLLTESGVADVVLCEADGAAGRSLKVHGANEPVVPACATSVAIIAGLDAIGQVPGPGVIHRFENFLETPQADREESVTARTCANILLLATARLDPGVPAVFILTKADDARARRNAKLVARELAIKWRHPTVIALSHQAFIHRHSGVAHDAPVERAKHASA